jgi:hypothetical protein
LARAGETVRGQWDAFIFVAFLSRTGSRAVGRSVAAVDEGALDPKSEPVVAM